MAIKKITEVSMAPEEWGEAIPNIYIEHDGVLYRATADQIAKLIGAGLDFEKIKNAVESGLGSDVDFDEDEQQLFLLDSEGNRIGIGTQIVAGLTGLSMQTEEDESGNYYLVTYDAKGIELCRVEFTPTGGGSGTAYVCRLINGMTSSRFSIPSGQSCVLAYEFYEYYGQEQTGVNATVQYSLKGATGDYMLLSTQDIQQGANRFDCTQFLSSGTNYLKISVTGGESGVEKVLIFTLNVVDVSLTSTFSDTVAYTGSISYLYKVFGKGLEKTMHFLVDDEVYADVSIGSSHNVQLSQIINLAKYGHGAHKLEVYFTTAEGTKSASLKYDIIFDAGESTPIVACSFDTESVTYGEPIYVNYVVFTHGSDYTESVKRKIYTYDGEGKRIDYSESVQSNVVNQKVQSWTITDYPTSGDIYLEISSGPSMRTFKVNVLPVSGDRDFSDVKTRLVASITASGRSNSDKDRDTISCLYTTKDGVKTEITAKIAGANYSSNGWCTDSDGYPVLRVSGDMECRMQLPFFAASYTDQKNQRVALAGTPTAAGRTFEVEFNAHDVTDYTKSVMEIFDPVGNIGIQIFPTRAYLLSDAMSITIDAQGNITNKNNIPYVEYKEDEKVRLGFVIEQNGYYQEDDGARKQLVRVYVNGEMSKAVAYSADSFTSTTAMPVIKAGGCILDVYSMRFYDYALGHEGILKNLIADKPSISEKIRIYDANNILDDSGDVSYEACLKLYPCMVLTGELSKYKGDKVKIGVYFTKPNAELDDGFYAELELMDVDTSGSFGNVNNVQGTSSQYYIKKNFKITFYRWDAVNQKWVKVGYKIFEDSIPVKTVCVKADYMSPDGANTANANFWQQLFTEKTPPQEADSRVQTAIRGYYIMMFHRKTANDKPEFIGRYNLNNDKGNSEAFGLENDTDSGNETKCQKWEYLDNSEDICNWKTDRLMEPRTDSDGTTYPAWMDALESTYPDQGDLEDEGLLPQLEYIQVAYTWVVQRANFLAASTVKDGKDHSYKGVSYATEYDQKLAIYRAEFEKHFNLHHTIMYFIANETVLLVDNFSKNFFDTIYDTTVQNLIFTDGSSSISDIIGEDGSVNAASIDWENSTFAVHYPTLYDLDSCLGADNNGYNQFPYYAEMWDSYNGKQIVNGSENVFWKLFYAAYYQEIKAEFKKKRDTERTLSYEKLKKAIIDDSTAALPVTAVNLDQKFKYIDAYEGGYLDYSTNSWLYTSAYLYLVKGTMALQHMDFLYKRFNMLDSKYMTDSYMQDNFNFRINAGQAEPEQLAFDITPAQTIYAYTEWGNSGSYIGGKTYEGKQITMKPASAGNWFDIVLAIYGASKMKSFGDLSPLIPSKLQGLSICSKLEELILGSEAEGYENAMLTSVADASYLSLLRIMNISNCTVLAGSVDLSNCPVIEEVYAKGSAVSSITLPTGGYLRKLHLSKATTTITIIGHNLLTDFQIEGYENLQKVWIEGTPGIQTDEILRQTLKQLSRIRVTDVKWVLKDETLLRMLVSDDAKGKVIDATGIEIDNPDAFPVITGTVTIDEIQGSLFDALQAAYPNLVISYKKKYHKVRFVDYDGKLISDQTLYDNESAATPTSPQRDPDVQFVWSFRGWDLSYTKVTSDMTITAQYSSALQQYDIEFYLTEGGEKQAEVLGVQYGVEYVYPEAEPTAAGKIFAGWRDKNGYFYEYSQQMPNQSAELDENGNPKAIQLYAVFQNIEMPATSKSLEEMTEGEKLFIAMAIQDGEAEGCTVTYYPDTNEYVVQDNTTLASVSLAPGDTAMFTLYGGEKLERQILDFNHDFSDLEETKPVGISYAFKNLMTDTRQMNPSYKHCFNYQIGQDEPIVSDNEDHNSVSNAEALALLDHEHLATDDEVTAGYVDIKALGLTYLRSIVVTHADGTTTSWEFDMKGFYADSDVAEFKKNAAGTAVNNAWYVSDLDINPDNPVYKIGKMFKSAGIPVVNADGTERDGFSYDQLTWAYFINQSYTFENFGGIKFDATGVDNQITAENNSFNGSGISRIVLLADYANDWNNFLEMSENAVISVPVVTGDVVTVKAYGYSRNWGGWDNSALCKWANADFLKLLPIAMRNTIVPVCKKFNIGNRNYTIRKGIYTAWLLSNAELKGWTTTPPYRDEGKPYPIFTNDASRIKYLANGAGAAYSWWERSPYRDYSSSFVSVNTSGYPNYGSWAGSRYGVALGFCSGRRPS